MSRVVCVLKTNEGGLWAVPQMVEVRRRGHEVTFVIPAGDGKLRRVLDELSIPVIESAFDFSFKPSPRLLRGLVRLRRQLASLDADVLFYHLYASALAVRLATLGRRLRRVHMVAGPLYLDSPLIRRVERVLCRLDDVIIGGSEHTAQRYRALGMPTHRVRAIPYGVDLDRFTPEGVTPEPSVNPDRFTVVMVAYVYAPKSSVYPGVGIKGHEVLLEAWSRFVADLPESELILVGAGFDAAGEVHRRTLQQQWSALGPHVRWIDSVADVRPWYAVSDVSVSPSLSENHGAALEASAMGCPSIVSDAGALPETVVPRETGWVIPAGDATALESCLRLAHCVWARGELEAMGGAARSLMVARFDRSQCDARVADAILEA